MAHWLSLPNSKPVVENGQFPTILIGNIQKPIEVLSIVRTIFSFPTTVNETSARIVAAGVVAQAVLFLLVRSGWLLVPLAFGFAARVVSGPSLSPLGQFATKVATAPIERRFGIDSRLVPGAPKRFAQSIGLVFTAGASIAWLLGATSVAVALIAGLLVAAGLEAGAGICLGCIVYNAIWGCADCADITRRSPSLERVTPG